MSAACASQIVSGLARDDALPPPARRVTARSAVVRAATATAPKPAKISDRRVGVAAVGSPAASVRDDARSSALLDDATDIERPCFIPVVDLDASDEACASAIREALFHPGVGFFHVRNHGVLRDAMARVAAAAEAFFDAPVCEKRALAVGDMKLSRGYEVSPEHARAMFDENRCSVETERADPEPSAARRIVGERFSAGPFGRPRDAYHSGEDGETFLAPNVWPSENEGDGCLREGMETYYGHMERLSNRVLRLVALAARAPPDFFEDKTDRHCSNLQVANYPTLRLEDWPDAAAAPPRKKAHADSGTITILARSRVPKPRTGSNEADGKARGGLQVLVGDDFWADVPTLAGGARDGADGVALLVNVGNQLQAWSDGHWRSTKHRVTNPDLVETSQTSQTTRRVSLAFFHKANYDAAVDAKAFLAFGGFGEDAKRRAAEKNAPVLAAGELSRVGMLRKFAKQGMDPAQASMAYHEALMGAEAAAEAAAGSGGKTASFKRSGESRGERVRCRCCPPDSGDGSLGLDRGSDDRGAGLGNDNPSARCPVCKGTGWKPCGQCDGTGVNQDDLFGGKFVKGDTCWLCAGKAKTMCGNCIDLTDSF